MKYYLDTEFIERPNTIDLISIGIKCEDGRKYYAISSEYDPLKASRWVMDNVIWPIYDQKTSKYYNRRYSVYNFHKFWGIPIKKIGQQIKEFLGYPDYKEGHPEFWGYYADYDWVVFCWIFGCMVDLPKGFPMYCRDLKQLIDESGKSPRGVVQKDEHNALADAEWNHKLHEYLMK